MIPIRPARPGEHAAVDALHRRSASAWEEDREVLRRNPEAIGVAASAFADGRVWVAAGDDEAPIGFVVTADSADGSWEIDDLFVDPAAMRRGVGTALLADVERRAIAAGVRELAATAHPRAQPFYERCGFEVTGPARTRFGPALRMRRKLVEG